MSEKIFKKDGSFQTFKVNDRVLHEVEMDLESQLGTSTAVTQENIANDDVREQVRDDDRFARYDRLRQKLAQELPASPIRKTRYRGEPSVITPIFKKDGSFQTFKVNDRTFRAIPRISAIVHPEKEDGTPNDNWDFIRDGGEEIVYDVVDITRVDNSSKIPVATGKRIGDVTERLAKEAMNYAEQTVEDGFWDKPKIRGFKNSDVQPSLIIAVTRWMENPKNADLIGLLKKMERQRARIQDLKRLGRDWWFVIKGVTGVTTDVIKTVWGTIKEIARGE